MTKPELEKRISEATGLSRNNTNLFLSGFINVLTEALVNGESVKLVGLGTFSTKIAPAKMVNNIALGQRVLAPERRLPTFKSSKYLKELVKQGA